jgi:hypothetical protein
MGVNHMKQINPLPDARQRLVNPSCLRFGRAVMRPRSFGNSVATKLTAGKPALQISAF